MNSIGDGNCRPAYLELLVAFLDEHADELCDECRERRDVNPLRTFDCKEKGCRAVMASAPEDHRPPVRRVRRPLRRRARAPRRARRRLRRRSAAWCAASTTTRAPRGSGSGRSWARQTTLSGGGRYDGLAEQLGGPADARRRVRRGRRAARADARGDGRRTEPAEPALDVLFAVLADEARPRVHALMDDARAAGVRCDAAYGGRRLKRALELADRRGVGHGRHRGRGRVGGRRGDGARYDSGEQRRVALDRLAEELRR